MFEKIITETHSFMQSISEFLGNAWTELIFFFGILKILILHRNVSIPKSFNHEFPNEMKILNKFLVDICKKEKIKNIPKIEVVNFFEPASALSLFSIIPSSIHLPKEELALQKDLKCAKATILHELAHIKHEDSFFSFMFFCVLYFSVLYCAFVSFEVSIIALMICTKIFQHYNHYIEYRADAMTKKYNLEFYLIKQLAWFEHAEPSCDTLTHPSLMKRNKKLNPKHHRLTLKKATRLLKLPL